MEIREYTLNSQVARKNFDEGNYDEALQQYQSLLKAAPNKVEYGKLSVFVAASLVNRDRGEDLAAGVKIYKTIVSDYSLQPIWRAIALTDIASLIRFRPVSFLQNNFPDTFYSSLLPENGTEQSRLDTVYYKLLMLSDETYPTSNAEYRLAFYYSEVLHTANFATTPETIEAATLAQKYVAEGDSRQDLPFFPPVIILNNYLGRTFGFSGSSVILQNKTVEERDAAYQLLFSTADSLQQDSLAGPSAGVLLTARFYYANFIRTYYPEQIEKIQNLLEPYGQLSSAPPTPSIFHNLPSHPDSSFVKSKSLLLAEISPKFKKFLTQLGITFK
jgi:hypothetical protein